MRLQLPNLQLYQPLQSYFFISRGSTKITLKVFLFFYQYALQSFVNFNKYLQREKPLLSRLHDQIQQFLKRIACKFLQTDFLASVDMFSDVWREQENQKSGSSDLWYFFLICFDIVFIRKDASLSNTIILSHSETATQRCS